MQKKSEKFRVLIFHKTGKTPFWNHFGLYQSENLKIRFFKKKNSFGSKISCCFNFKQKTRQKP